MKAINASIQTQMESGQLVPFNILDMDIDSTHYRYTNCEIPLVVNSVRYESRDFKVGDIVTSNGLIIEQMQLDLWHLDADQDQDEVSALTSVFVGGTPQGSSVLYATVLLNASTFKPLGDTYFTLFNGILGQWSLTEDTLSITVNSLLDQWSQRTLSLHPPSCRWKVFKGTECGYSGAETQCDRSYTRCTELSNTDNFGGFRWLPSIIDKTFKWSHGVVVAPLHFVLTHRR